MLVEKAPVLLLYTEMHPTELSIFKVNADEAAGTTCVHTLPTELSVCLNVFAWLYSHNDFSSCIFSFLFF